MTDNAIQAEPQSQPLSSSIAGAEPPVQVSPREEFIKSLPEEYRTNPAFAKFDSWEGVAKSYVNIEKMVGMDKNQIVALPKEDTPEAWSPVWDKIGRPSDVKGYEIEKYAEAIPSDVLSNYAEIAHNNGVPKKAFDAMIGKFVEETKAGQAAMQEQEAQKIGAWQEEIKKEFGMAYEEKMAFAKKAVEKFGLSEAIQENFAMFEHPAIIKALVAIGEKTSEGMVLANGSVTHGKLAPAEALMEWSKFSSDKDNMAILTNKQHPQHEYMLKKKAELFKMAYPDK